MVNRLADATSPYLLQHAENPVDWWEWGPEAVEEARRRDAPILLSIGYSSCHWCHVMARESFEDPGTAEVMNRLFVNVKVDREERPDVDALYMEAVQALTGQGGWPLTVFCDPDGRPFFGGTYFPREPTSGRPGFVQLMEAVADAWRNRRDDLRESTGRLMEALGHDPLRAAAGSGGSAPPAGPTAALLDAAVADAARRFDPRDGGFSDAPKFPAPMLLDVLLRHHVHHPSTATLAIVTTTLDAMAAGGIHDQLGGGFHRYSVDRHWTVPHFEKMLSDQALLAATYLRAHLVTGEERYRRVVETTVDHVLREMRLPGGGFCTALDADSEGVEGRYYVWGTDEIEEVAGADAPAAIAYYGAVPGGNFTDPHTGFRGNVLHVVDRGEPPSPAVERARAALLERRGTRVPPRLDDKVLAGWNALMLRTLAEAGAALGRDDWVAEARAGAAFLLTNLRRPDGRWLRSWHPDGGARHLAFSADYGSLLEAFVTLAEVDDIGWLDEANRLAADLVRLFHDADGGGFLTAGRDAERLAAVGKDIQDNALPSGNSLAASGLLRLAALTGDRDAAAPALDALRRLTPLVQRFPGAFAYALAAVEYVVHEPIEVAVVGPAGPARDALRAEVAGRLLPATVWCSAPGPAESSGPAESPSGSGGAGGRGGGTPRPPTPLLEGRTAIGGDPTAYVCERFTCRAPTTDPRELRRQLDAALAARDRAATA